MGRAVRRRGSRRRGDGSWHPHLAGWPHPDGLRGERALAAAAFRHQGKAGQRRISMEASSVRPLTATARRRPAPPGPTRSPPAMVPNICALLGLVGGQHRPHPAQRRRRAAGVTVATQMDHRLAAREPLRTTRRVHQAGRPKEGEPPASGSALAAWPERYPSRGNGRGEQLGRDPALCPVFGPDAQPVLVALFKDGPSLGRGCRPPAAEISGASRDGAARRRAPWPSVFATRNAAASASAGRAPSSSTASGAWVRDRDVASVDSGGSSARTTVSKVPVRATFASGGW